MTSELRVDNLKGSTTGGSISVLGEGTSATTNLQQGLDKSWCHLNGSSFGISDSFNVASADDNGTGQYDVNYTNNFSSANNCPVGIANNFTLFVDSVPTTSTFNMGTRASGNSNSDSSVVSTKTSGDLA
jgi:hypothetical protein